MKLGDGGKDDMMKKRQQAVIQKWGENIKNGRDAMIEETRE